MSEYKKIENAKAELKCTLEGETWDSAKESAFKKIAGKVEIKGFRKGQAPKHLVEKYISHNEVLLEAAESLAQKTLENAVEEHDLTLIDRPELKVDEINDDKCVLTFVCPVLPDVKLGDYKSIEYKVEEAKVDDKEVDDQIVTLLNQKADLELKEDGEVEDGDTTVIDFEGFKDGEPFEGGKADNYDLVIGSNSFIPGFEQQLIGMKAEETKEIDVTFPDTYHVEELKGQPAKFKVTVHEIKKKVLPELNDEFAAELKYENVNTVEDLKKYTKDNLLKRKEDDNKRKAEDDLIDKLVEMTEVDIPDVLVKSETDNIVQNYEQNFMQQGFSLAQFLQMTGQKMEDFRDSLKENAIKRIKVNLALDEIGKLENVEVSDDDVNEEYKKMSEMYSMDIEDVKKYVPASSIKSDLKYQKTLDFLKK